MRKAQDPKTRPESCGQEQAHDNQRRPSIKATIRSVRRRADGMMKNAVAAATGQAMKYALAHWIRKSGRKPRSRKVTRSVTMHTITLDISSANISRDLASMLIRSPGHGGLWRNPSSFADAA